MRQIKTAVIGLGWMGSHYARIASQAHNCQLLAVCDQSKKTLKDIKRELSVDGYTSADAMFGANPDLEAVIIVTPEPAHLEPVREAVQAGVNILLEKPVATDIQDAREIVEICRESNLTLGICHHMRFDPRYAAVHDAIARGEIGELIHIFARRNLPTWSPQHLNGRIEIAFWTGVHDIDMMNWVVGSKVVKVTAKGSKRYLHDFGVYDVIVSILEYEDGTIAVLENSWATPAVQGRPRSFVFEVRGTEGVAEVAGYETGSKIYTKDKAEVLDTYYRMNLNGAWIGPYRDLVVHFLDSLIENKKPLITGEDGLASTLVADAILRSLYSGETAAVDW